MTAPARNGRKWPVFVTSTPKPAARLKTCLGCARCSFLWNRRLWLAKTSRSCDSLAFFSFSLALYFNEAGSNRLKIFLERVQFSVFKLHIYVPRCFMVSRVFSLAILHFQEFFTQTCASNFEQHVNLFITLIPMLVSPNDLKGNSFPLMSKLFIPVIVVTFKFTK